jgi:fimbrial chaperone protein
MPLALARLALLLIVLPLAAQPRPALGADLQLMPVAVHLDRLRDRATVQVANHGSEPVILQADATAWIRESGQDRDVPTDALIVNPPVFTVQPGRTQVVRLGLRRGADVAQETTYRMVLREVPPPADADRQIVSGTVRVLVALRVPVYVAPATVRRDERWQMRLDADGHVVARVTNAGNVHMKLGSLRLHDGTDRVLAEQVTGGVLFPGEEGSFRLLPRGPRSGAPITLRVVTDRGSHDVALDPPH